MQSPRALVPLHKYCVKLLTAATDWSKTTGAAAAVMLLCLPHVAVGPFAVIWSSIPHSPLPPPPRRILKNPSSPLQRMPVITSTCCVGSRLTSRDSKSYTHTHMLRNRKRMLQGGSLGNAPVLGAVFYSPADDADRCDTLTDKTKSAAISSSSPWPPRDLPVTW